MGCTCFSSDKTVKCDHQASGGDTITIELADDPNEFVIIDDEVVRELLEEKRQSECPRGKWCMRAAGKSPKECSAKPNTCVLRDGPTATGKALDDDEERLAAAVRVGQRTSQYYDEFYTRASRERDLRERFLSLFAGAAPQTVYAAISAWNADQSRQRTGDMVFLGSHFPPHVQWLYL
jgi:hypothetical protein